MNRRRSPINRRRVSLRRLLRFTQLRSMVLTLGLAGVSLTLIGLLTLSNYATHNLQLLSRSLAYTLEAAVVFNDAGAAQEGLELIVLSEEISEAIVHGRNGQMLASWRNPDTGVWQRIEHRVANLLLPQPLTRVIHYEGEPVGSLQLSVQGSTLVRFLTLGLLAVVATVLVSALMANYVSRRMQRVIMSPLSELSRVARTIASERQFDQRAPASKIRELNSLAEDFNSLLDEIEIWQNHLQRENASLAHRASHDPLTGLPNRAQFETALLRALREARDSDQRCGMMFLDCNRFKEINDELGHAAGDAVLISVANRLRAQLRESDLIARLGGDEFAVLLCPVHHEDDVLAVADKIIAGMSEPITFPYGDPIQMSVSIGIAMFPEHASSPKALTQAADAAMYHAKRNQGGYHLSQSRPAHSDNHQQGPPQCL